MSKSASCSMLTFLDMLGGIWRILLLVILAKGEISYGKPKFIEPNISNKILTENSKKLEELNFVAKHYDKVTNKVFYKLTEQGFSLIPTTKDISVWMQKTFLENNFKDVYLN